MGSSSQPLSTSHPEESQGSFLPATEAKGEVVPTNLRQAYQKYFEVIVADNEQLLTEAYRLRYQVYCVENPYEDPAENPGQLETDHFDQRSVHCLLRHKPTGAMAGTVRIVLPNRDDPDNSFVMQRECKDPMIRDPERFPIDRMAEISRLCISKAFRQRKGDRRYPRNEEEQGRPDERRAIPNMVLGLYEGMVRMSVVHDIEHWCGLLEPTLLRMVKPFGLYADKIGPIVDYHGRRQPCYMELKRLLKDVKKVRPDIWQVLTDGGRHSDALHCKNRDKGR